MPAPLEKNIALFDDRVLLEAIAQIAASRRASASPDAQHLQQLQAQRPVTNGPPAAAAATAAGAAAGAARALVVGVARELVAFVNTHCGFFREWRAASGATSTNSSSESKRGSVSGKGTAETNDRCSGGGGEGGAGSAEAGKEAERGGEGGGGEPWPLTPLGQVLTEARGYLDNRWWRNSSRSASSSGSDGGISGGRDASDGEAAAAGALLLSASASTAGSAADTPSSSTAAAQLQGSADAEATAGGAQAQALPAAGIRGSAETGFCPTLHRMPSEHEFLFEYLARNRPLLIKGCVRRLTVVPSPA